MDQTKSIWKILPLCFLLGVVTIATYSPATRSEFIGYDDPDYVTSNEVVKQGLTWGGVKWAFSTNHASNWHPVTWLSHMLDVRWFGLDAGRHHRTNVLIHAVNAALLLLLLWQMTGAVWRSAFVAGLFALHPLHVESVAWVAERKDVLSTSFGLLCLMAYARYTRSTANECSTPRPNSSPFVAVRPKWSWYGLAWILLALGLMSKPMLVTWPFVMLLLDYWPLKRIEPATINLELPRLKRLTLEKVPFFALLVGSCIVTFLVQQQGGAVLATESLPVEDRLGNAIVSYVRYLFLTVWPSNLAIYYPHPELRHPASTQWPWWAIGLAALVLAGISVLAIRRRKEKPFLFTGWFLFLGTLIPVIGIVQVGTQAMADRYTYVPLIGIFILIAWGMEAICQRYKLPAAVHPMMGIALVAICTGLSRHQVLVWQDDFSVFGRALQVTEGNAPAHSSLGKAWARKGDFEKALEHLRAAKDADPHYPNVHYDTGLTLFYLGRYTEAIEEYRAELDQKPDHLMARNNLASAYRSAGKPEAAIEQYQLILQANPNYLQSLLGLGSTMAGLGRAEEAEQYLTRALEINPKLDEARVDLARILASVERYTEAERMLRNVSGLDANPRFQVVLGNILMESGQINEAAGIFRTASQRFPQLAGEYLGEGKRQLQLGNPQAALGNFVSAGRLSPTLAEAHQHAGLILAQLGRIQAATSSFETVVRLEPSASAYYQLALAYASQSRVSEAIVGYRKAIELKPDMANALNNLAWILATHPDPSLRDGQMAVELAQHACKASDYKQPILLGTLAAAYAEAGRFDEAIRTGEQARQLADQSGLTELAARNTELLQQYRAGKPHRETLAPLR